MFSSLGLFQSLPCPEKERCRRPHCLYSHKPDVKEISAIHIPIDAPRAQARPVLPTSSSSGPSRSVASSSKVHAAVPAKRSVDSPPRGTASPIRASHVEPPRKLQKTGPTARATATPSASVGTDGAPMLRVNAAQSLIAIPIRQTMLNTLWEHFKVLYNKIHDRNPTLAAEHALRQEEEVYNKSTKLTYRNAMISSIATLKKRSIPESMNHPSIGTEGDIAKLEESQKKLQALQLTVEHLEPLILSLDEMRTWGYVVEIPQGAGGGQPSEEGAIQKCERCNEQFLVKRMEEADECEFHWGRPFTSKANGEKRRVYQCCSRTTDEDPCSKGPHVFYESDPVLLHQRHAFSNTRPPRDEDETALEIVALDCEMIYTTGGMRVARVSVINSTGKEVFDEFIRMDDGVEVIDFNTRFSGVTQTAYAKADKQLAQIRQSLDRLINSRTIIIGHALENDLKTLRMIHHRCLDTVALFPHPGGPPYRRALRHLAKDHLNRTIQVGGAAEGHSSVEDSVATLDLVRWHVLNGRPRYRPKTEEPKPESKPTEVIIID